MNSYSTTPPQLSLPTDLGLQAFEVGQDENPHASDRSMSGSIVSNSGKSRRNSRPDSSDDSALPVFPPKVIARSPMASPIAEAHDPLMGKFVISVSTSSR
jgi:hypothetical protein